MRGRCAHAMLGRVGRGRPGRIRTLLLLFLVGLPWVAHPHASRAGGAHPSVLLVAPRDLQHQLVDYEYLRRLQEAGFKPDTLDDLSDFTWARIRRYHVLVLFGAPAEREGDGTVFGPQPLDSQSYSALVERFLAAGGGVLAMLYPKNGDAGLRSLLEPWGARLPLERYVESDPSRIAPVPHMDDRGHLVLLDAVAPSPISNGVEQLWWPYGTQYNASMSSPIHVSGDWQVVVRGSATSRTEPVTRQNTTRYLKPPPDPLVREGGVPRPPLLAIREYAQGRILLTAQYPQFSIGQGTRWLYDDRALWKGLRGKPSHWDRMLRNALHWLAEPSLREARLGGHRMDPQHLVPPNRRSGARAEMERRFLHDPKAVPAISKGRLYRGLLGARTVLSGGRSTMEEYAAAARRAGLDFLIFMEDFASLTEAELRELDGLCEAHSGEDLLLLPGYSIDNNIGNHLFFYGYDLPWPPDFAVHRAEDGRPRLNQQMQDEEGRYIVAKTTHNWLLQQHDTGGGGTQNVGFYDFDDPRALRMHDTKDATAAAIRTYRGGVLRDESLEDFLLTAESTMPKLPVVVHQLSTAEELVRAVEAGTMLIHARAASLRDLPAALGWYNQYAGDEVFVSDGPRIEAWPGFPRLFTYAAEPFVVSQEWMPSLLHVTSDVPLREVRVYDGRRRIRRFLPRGRKELRQVLHLSNVVQQNLVVVAEDERGGIAVSAARRARREGGLGISFCGDHVNDCTPFGLLGRGPGMFQLQLHPHMDPHRAGYTWDGGPEGRLPTVRFHPATMIKSDRGEEGSRPYNNLPMLEMADDQAVVVRSELEEVYDERIPAVNAWHTWGPIDPSRLLRATRRFGRFNRPAVAPQATHWGFYGQREGAIVAWYANDVTFLQAQRVGRLRIARSDGVARKRLFLATRRAERADDAAFEVRDLSQGPKHAELKLPRGGWFGFFTEGVGNDTLFLNRGEPLVLRATRRGDGGLVLELDVDLAEPDVTKGETAHVELLSINEPLDPPARGPARYERLVRYLEQPEGMRIARGRRLPEAGFVALSVADGIAEIALERPAARIGIPVPVRIEGLNPDWSVGLWQREGHTTGYYTDGRDVYQALGLDRDGRAYLSLYPDHAPRTHVVVGHPVMCDAEGLVIEATPGPAETGAPSRYAWHVAVHNPTDSPIRSTCRAAMDAPGLTLEPATRTVPAGASIILAPSKP